MLRRLFLALPGAAFAANMVEKVKTGIKERIKNPIETLVSYTPSVSKWEEGTTKKGGTEIKIERITKEEYENFKDKESEQTGQERIHFEFPYYYKITNTFEIQNELASLCNPDHYKVRMVDKNYVKVRHTIR